MSQIDRRLKNVQQADLTESRVNDDFVHWLRTWGSNVLLAVLLVAAAAMGWYKWTQVKEDARDAAWKDLGEATLPTALTEVASKHQGKDAVAVFAKLRAADTYIGAVTSGKRFDRDAAAADAAITPELRTEWLKEADKLYADVAASTEKGTTLGDMGFQFAALFGRAAVAEDLGDLKASEGYLTTIRDRAKGTDYAATGEVAAKRLANVQSLANRVELPKKPVAPVIPNLGAAPAGTDLRVGDGNTSLTLTPSGGAAAPAAPAAPAPADAPKKP